MSNLTHLQKLRSCINSPQGGERWNQWRSTNNLEVLDLSDSILSDLWDVPLIEVPELSNFDLRSVNFKGSDLKGVRFTHAQSLADSDFTNCNLQGALFNGLDLSRVCLTNANVLGAYFIGANLGTLCGEAKYIENAHFQNSSFSHTNWQNINFSKKSFNSCNFNSCNWRNILFEHCDFTQCTFDSATFENCAFDNCDLESEDLSKTLFIRCEFRNQTNIASASFRDSTLKGIDLSDCNINSHTTFRGANVTGCKMTRHQLERLTDYGDLTTGDRMDMDIVDPVALLRAKYSGFWQWFHVIALLIFLFPYFWFLFSKWSIAQFEIQGSEYSIMLGVALARYVFNGGINWQNGFDFHWSFLLFMFLMFYNVLRGLFLMKTKQLELEEESSGLPPKFDLGTSWLSWGWWFKWANYASYAYLGIGIINILHFLRMEIPLGI